MSSSPVLHEFRTPLNRASNIVLVLAKNHRPAWVGHRAGARLLETLANLWSSDCFVFVPKLEKLRAVQRGVDVPLLLHGEN